MIVKSQALSPKTLPVEFNADGKAVANFETIDVPMPGLLVNVKVRAGYFPRRGADLPGWRAEATLTVKEYSMYGRLSESSAGSGLCRQRPHAVLDAVEALTNSLVNQQDRARGNLRKWFKTVINALNAWVEAFEKQAKKESTAMTVQKSTKILTSKECKALLEDFRRSYESLQHRFLELGDKAIAIREQEAYGESCETFDQWIKSEGYGHTFVYGAMKAARLYRLMAPTLEPRQITLDCESHYRDIPADVTPKQAEKIAAKLVELVNGDVRSAADTRPRVTRQQVKAAVAAAQPKPPATRPDVPESIEAEIVAMEPREEDGERGRVGDGEKNASPHPPIAPSPPPNSPRVAPKTITGDYREVLAEESGHEPAAAEMPDEGRLEQLIHQAKCITPLDKGQWRNRLVNVASAKDWLGLLCNPVPSDGSDPDYWHGQPHRHARQLRSLTEIIRRLAAWKQPGPPGVGGTGSSPRENMPGLLRSLAAEIEAEDSSDLPGRRTAARRAK